MQKRVTPFKNDPFSFAWKAFEELYPEKQCEVLWHPDIQSDNPEEPAYGFTEFCDDGVILVFVSSKLSVEDAAEILAHELAHVAVGVEQSHNDEWENAFEAIHKKYEEIVLLELGK